MCVDVQTCQRSSVQKIEACYHAHIMLRGQANTDNKFFLSVFVQFLMSLCTLFNTAYNTFN